MGIDPLFCEPQKKIARSHGDSVTSHTVCRVEPRRHQDVVCVGGCVWHSGSCKRYADRGTAVLQSALVVKHHQPK